MPCPILMYHFVGEPKDPDDAPYFVSEEKFEEQMNFLFKNGFRSVNIKDLISALYEGHSIPKKSVVITFDDGHLSFYKMAIPILKKYGLKSIMFVITDRVGQPNFMNWEQIRSVSQQGVSIESHSVTHRILTELDMDEVEKELLDSKSILESNLESEVEFFCYRGGHYNDSVKSFVTSSGYKAAVCSRFGYNDSNVDRFELERIPIRGDDDLNIFRAKVYGLNWQSRKGRFLSKYFLPVKNTIFG